MLVSWLLLWIMLAALQTHLDGRLDLAKAFGRGIITAFVAAVGFGVVLFQLYRGWPPETYSVLQAFCRLGDGLFARPVRVAETLSS